MAFLPCVSLRPCPAPTVVSIDANAKINLHLAIGRRSGGFHEIESIFVLVSLRDTLRFEWTPCGAQEPRTTVTMRVLTSAPELAALEDKDNLVFKAIELFRQDTGWRDHVSVTVTKRIPAGAGLGGGSSDAAAALRALSRIVPLDDAALTVLAGKLGSDVPFFLGKGGAAYVRGRGEDLTPLKTPRHYLVIIKPAFSSATAEAFKRLDEARALNALPAQSFGLGGAEGARTALEAEPETWRFYNDFLPLFLHAEDTNRPYTQMLTALRRHGALFTGLSGSGSACFGVFHHKTTAARACRLLKGSAAFVCSARFCEPAAAHTASHPALNVPAV